MESLGLGFFLMPPKFPMNPLESRWLEQIGGKLDVSLILSVVGNVGGGKFPRRTEEKWN